MKQPTTTAGARTPETIQAEPVKMQKRIVSTTYTVSVHFSKSSTETMNDKILRLIKMDFLGVILAAPVGKSSLLKLKPVMLKRSSAKIC